MKEGLATIFGTSTESLSTREKPHQSPLASYIERQIQRHGPMSFADYMQAWAYGVHDSGIVIPGYYSGDKAVIGDQDRAIKEDSVDFWTPSEETPLYGVCMADQMLQMWDTLENPDKFTIVEMGAGNGTFAHDVLHGFSYLQKTRKRQDDILNSLNYIIIENSPRLRSEQAKTLRDVPGSVTIIDSTAEEKVLDKVTGVFVSTELPDAFPTHIVKKEKGEVQELFVGTGNSDRFSPLWTTPAHDVSAFLDNFAIDIPEGSQYPVNLSAVRWMQSVAQSLERGYVITTDYEHSESAFPVWLVGSPEKGMGGSRSRDIFNKQFVGETDITSGVDFHTLSEAGKRENLLPAGYVTLQGFLFSLCFDHRLGELVDKQLGSRIVSMSRAEGLYTSNDWNVLMQSKGIEGKDKLFGAYFPFNDDPGGTPEYIRERFRPIIA